MYLMHILLFLFFFLFSVVVLFYLVAVVSIIVLFFLIYIYLSNFILFFILCYCIAPFLLLLLFFFFHATCLTGSGSQATGCARAPVVAAPSPNRWTNREPQTPGNINRSEASQRSSSQHQDPDLSNCLQTPVLDASGQIICKTGIKPQPSEKKIK